jgi:hypothetical protein
MEPYSWITFNCEHFVRHAHDVAVESPQLKRWATLAGVFAFGFALTRA